MNTSNQPFCDITLKLILIDFEERLETLKKRKLTPITLGKINEIQECILYIQQKRLDNLKNTL